MKDMDNNNDGKKIKLRSTDNKLLTICWGNYIAYTDAIAIS